jgi:hypothetical protein
MSVDVKIIFASSSPEVSRSFLMHVLHSHKYSAVGYCQLNVPKRLCGTHDKHSGKWILKYVGYDIWKIMCNYCLSVKHTQSSNH